MLLVIDVGNTNVVAGVYEGEELLVHWRFSSDRSKTADEYGILLSSMFAYTHVDMTKVSAIIISTVVPPLLVPLCNMCKRYFDINPVVVGVGIKTGLVLRYDNPREIGADRIVNAVAAHTKYKDKGNLIIIDFGTATTFCALLPDGEYLGGAIAPGIGISTEALFQKAAKLPRIELKKPNKVICRNTVKAMQSGVIFGFVGQMDGIVARMKEELGGQAFVIATGGFANTMAAESEHVDVVESFLTLDGLRILYEHNKK
ncbi:Type III pantothenate kinase [bioreactor metagenome]|jgi:pantothenate kinase, type III|uniref:Type III pantothenate kinase n=1 Tax=bioreactor metagenome TaxID=1076179 RepID=A0A644VRD0_9ZZZZ|nr:type III pantothenate kinase [Acidaminococcaceae bacterium]NLU44069.1 type III pantothenate kinase [Acholeplasmataceae bacterium]